MPYRQAQQSTCTGTKIENINQDTRLGHGQNKKLNIHPQGAARNAYNVIASKQILFFDSSGHQYQFDFTSKEVHPKKTVCECLITSLGSESWTETVDLFNTKTLPRVNVQGGIASLVQLW